MQNFAASGSIGVGDPNRGYRADVAKAPGQVAILVGEQDESMFPEKYTVAFADLEPRVPIQVLPGIHHMDLISDPVALARVAEVINLP